MPNSLYLVFFLINSSITFLDNPVFFSILSTWIFAAFIDICGSRPDADCVIISSGISDFFIDGFSSNNLLVSWLILCFNSGLLTAKFSLPEDIASCLFPVNTL